MYIPAIRSPPWGGFGGPTRIAYSQGSELFCSHQFRVSESVMVPRRGTEAVAQRAAQELKVLKGSGPRRLLDLGTGSGCIAISALLALEEGCEAEAVGLDSSAEALAVAQSNAENLLRTPRHFRGVEACFSDLGSPSLARTLMDSNHAFDVVVANPPYLTRAQASELLGPKTEAKEPWQAFVFQRTAKVKTALKGHKGDVDGAIVAYAVLLTALDSAQEAGFPLLKEGGALVLEVPAALEASVRRLVLEAPRAKAQASAPRSVCPVCCWAALGLRLPGAGRASRCELGLRGSLCLEERFLDASGVFRGFVFRRRSALLLSHPHVLIRDTSLFRPLRPAEQKRTPSLRKLAQHWLQETIQEGTHDSVMDARIALRLYALKSKIWEKHMRPAMQHHSGAGRHPAVVDTELIDLPLQKGWLRLDLQKCELEDGLKATECIHETPASKMLLQIASRIPLRRKSIITIIINNIIITSTTTITIAITIITIIIVIISTISMISTVSIHSISSIISIININNIIGMIGIIILIIITIVIIFISITTIIIIIITTAVIIIFTDFSSSSSQPSSSTVIVIVIVMSHEHQHQPSPLLLVLFFLEEDDGERVDREEVPQTRKPGWVKQKLAQVLTMSVEPGVQMADNCALFVVGKSEYRVESTFGLFWARIVDVDYTSVNTLPWDTAEQVRDRLATKLSAKNNKAYKAVLDEICDNGIDGRILSEEDLPLEELESFSQLSGLQAKVLRNHLARYKATSKEAVPRVAICIVASTVTLEFNSIPDYLFKNRVLGRVCQEKIMTYLKMRMAAEKPHELLDMHPDSPCTTVASEAEMSISHDDVGIRIPRNFQAKEKGGLRKCRCQAEDDPEEGHEEEETCGFRLAATAPPTSLPRGLPGLPEPCHPSCVDDEVNASDRIEHDWADGANIRIRAAARMGAEKRLRGL
ncbi:50S ribosomal protein L3 glutamine methyltransferase [Symbiodinium microadriaticum]|uniref:50S ribosomal protein L3 glutamine methyltransferase n=1 Tax=Symbiodinium microadriaticum TaxID=2951 RepID=A0A1Q9EBX0_SYMMI|nr:50S ribosomal protein L3 glutamine methyltransferase [Symbiodinium microadriaticum]